MSRSERRAMWTKMNTQKANQFVVQREDFARYSASHARGSRTDGLTTRPQKKIEIEKNKILQYY